MRLSDIMGHLDLTVWPMVAMVLFVSVYVTAVVRVCRRPAAECRRAASLPLDDGQAVSEPAGAATCSGGGQ